MKKKWVFIIIPHFGSRRKTALLHYLTVYIGNKLYDYNILYTTHKEHVAELPQQAAPGIIPKDSGNDLAYHLGLKRNIKKAIQVKNSHELFRINSDKTNTKLFIKLAGLGVDAALVFGIMNNTIKGFFLYVSSCLKEISGFKFINSIFSVKRDSIWKYITTLSAMAQKTVNQSPYVRFLKGQRIVVTTTRKKSYHAAGKDFNTYEKIQIENVTSSIYLLIQKI